MTLGLPAEVIDMKDYDPDDQLADEVRRVQREDAFSSINKRQQRHMVLNLISVSINKKRNRCQRQRCSSLSNP